MNSWRSLVAIASGTLLLLGGIGPTQAARTSDVRNTLHNLSSTGQGAVKAAGESEVCVFCHTPHAADTSQTPLWNKTLAAKTYTVYTSNSLDAETIKGASLDQPMGSSKLCLSCHDGAMALGSVRVLRGVANPANIGVANTGAGGVMPGGSGTTTGYTRNIGAGVLGQTTGFDLTNDHPISVTYDAALASRDGELRSMNASQQSPILINSTHPLFGKRAAGQSASRPVLPLEPTGASGAGQVQCTTCHDPHLKGDLSDLAAEGNIKFLRRPRVQTVQPTYVDVVGGAYGDSGNIICLACHDKGLQGKGGNSWNYSAHANSLVATQPYRPEAATTRNLPTSIRVWQASCLNCHDTHTVTGSRRLLREGTDATPSTALYLGGFKAGGSSALEETCYQCHRDAANSILSNSTSVPNIRSDFNITNGYRMPITSGDQDAGVEMHDPGSGRAGFGVNDGYAGGVVNGLTTSGSKCLAADNDKCGADLIESRSLLGTTATNRHVECTDCHNPHRVVKNKLFYGSGGSVQSPDASGTHNHTDTAMIHTNIASGVLRGTWGVEPTYGSNTFHSSASNWTVRRGDPGIEMPNNGVTMPLSSTNMDDNGFVTREYQVCLKCHSNYGFNSPPNLRASASRKGLTASGTNGMTQYTDQAKEFQAPDIHMDEPANGNTGTGVGNIGANGGAGSAFNANNHRSWHPVMRSTGRSVAERGINKPAGGNPWLLPWKNAVGSQTMYCTDCHGSATGTGTVIPAGGEDGSPWGPHGSSYPFILKGGWSITTGQDGTQTTDICFKCHDYTTYANGTSNPEGKGCNDDTQIKKTGFSNGTFDLHCHHVVKIGKRLQCQWCHVAVPHGWKNKALLVNLNDVSQEAGYAADSSLEVAMNGHGNYFTKSPYYNYAKNKVRNFSTSGNWAEGNCGSLGRTGSGSLLITDTTTGASSSQASDGKANSNGRTWMANVCKPTN